MGVLCKTQNRPRWKAKVLWGPEKQLFFDLTCCEGPQYIIILFAKQPSAIQYVTVQIFLPKSNQATAWPRSNFRFNCIQPRTETGLKLAAGVERRNVQTVSPVSLVWVPPTRRHSQYPCPKYDIAVLLYNIFNACMLKQRLIGANSEMHLFPAKVGVKYAPGPTNLQ